MKNANLRIVDGQYHDPQVGPVEFIQAGTGKKQPTSSGNWYIRTVPYEWQRRANAIGGNAGVVGHSLWYQAGVKQSMSFRVTSQTITLAGCCRQTFAKALCKLEAAGLICIDQKDGRRAEVTILPPKR